MYSRPALVPAQKSRSYAYVTGLQGIAANSTISGFLPPKRRYHYLKVITTIGGVLTDPTTIISNIKITVKGAVMLNWTPAQLIAYEKLNFFSYVPKTGEVPISFSEPNRLTPAAQEASSWDMLDLSNGDAVIEMTTTGIGGVIGCKILACYDELPNVRMVNGAAQRFLSIFKKVALNGYALNTGMNNVTNIPTQFPLHRILLSTTAAQIADVLVLADSRKKLQATAAENAMVLNDHAMDASQFTFPIVFDVTQQYGDALICGNLDVGIDMVSAQTVNILVVNRVNGWK